MPRRDSRGRFVKSGGSSTITRTRRTGGGAIVVRTSSTPARRSRGGGRRRGATASSGERVRKGAAIGGAILGYVKKHHSAETLNRIPPIKGSHMATLAIGLHFLKPKPGGILDHIATASVAVAAYELGQSLSGEEGSAEW